MHLEYGHNCQGRLVHPSIHQASYITKQFTVESVTAKRTRYSTKKFETAEFMIAKQVQQSTIWLTVLAHGTAKHAWYRAVVVCVCVKPFFFGQRMHLEYSHCRQNKVQRGKV